MLARRVFFAVVLLGFLANASKAEFTRLGPNYFVAGVVSDQFKYSAAPEVQGRQRQANWCWAACVQMVLNFHGLTVSQEQIVNRIFGQQIDQSASADQILQALNGWAPDYRGRFSAIASTRYIMNDNDVIGDLAYRWPLIVGLQNSDGSGHTYVLTAIFFSLDSFNQPVFDKVVLRDPSPANQSRQEWSWAAFQAKLTLTARVHVFRL